MIYKNKNKAKPKTKSFIKDFFYFWGKYFFKPSSLRV